MASTTLSGDKYWNQSHFFYREIQWILFHLISGKSVISILLWGTGMLLILAATVQALLAVHFMNPHRICTAAFLNGIGALFLLGSVVNLYGPFFSGPAGIAIPFGIPVILGVAYWQYHWQSEKLFDEHGDVP